MNIHQFARPLCRVVLLLAVGLAIGSQSAAAQTCDTVTDADLVASVLNELKADSLLAPQMSHIVVGSVNRFVKLQGWTDNKRSYERLISIVSGVACVKAINVNNFEEVPPPPDSPLRPSPTGCPTGSKLCGDVCIPEGDACSDPKKSATD